MPPSVICPDTWPVLWMVTLMSPADWFIVVLMFSVGIHVLCSAFSLGRSFVDAAMRVPRFQLLMVAALLVASLVSFVLLVQWPVTYANNVDFFNFFGVAAAAAFPLCVFTTAATDALWAGGATHIGKAEEKDTCKGVKLVTFQMCAPQVNVWEGSAAASVYSDTQVSQPAAAALSGAFVGVPLVSIVCTLAIGCIPGLSYHVYSVGILVTVADAAPVGSWRLFVAVDVSHPSTHEGLFWDFGFRMSHALLRWLCVLFLRSTVSSH